LTHFGDKTIIAKAAHHSIRLEKNKNIFETDTAVSRQDVTDSAGLYHSQTFCFWNITKHQTIWQYQYL